MRLYKNVFVILTGYYTRSGFVPGPVCKYNWTLVWDVAEEKQKYLNPQVIKYNTCIKFTIILKKNYY